MFFLLWPSHVAVLYDQTKTSFLSWMKKIFGEICKSCRTFFAGDDPTHVNKDFTVTLWNKHFLLCQPSKRHCPAAFDCVWSGMSSITGTCLQDFYLTCFRITMTRTRLFMSSPEQLKAGGSCNWLRSCDLAAGLRVHRPVIVAFSSLTGFFLQLLPIFMLCKVWKENTKSYWEFQKIFSFVQCSKYNVFVLVLVLFPSSWPNFCFPFFVLQFKTKNRKTNEDFFTE